VHILLNTNTLTGNRKILQGRTSRLKIFWQKISAKTYVLLDSSYEQYIDS